MNNKKSVGNHRRAEKFGIVEFRLLLCGVPPRRGWGEPSFGDSPPPGVGGGGPSSVWGGMDMGGGVNFFVVQGEQCILGAASSRSKQPQAVKIFLRQRHCSKLLCKWVKTTAGQMGIT